MASISRTRKVFKSRAWVYRMCPGCGSGQGVNDPPVYPCWKCGMPTEPALRTSAPRTGDLDVDAATAARLKAEYAPLPPTPAAEHPAGWRPGDDLWPPAKPPGGKL